MFSTARIQDKVKQAFELKTYEMTAAAALAALSASLQIVHIGWASPWGMWIDLVAIPWLIAYFLYGGRTAFVVSLVGAIIITIAAPSSWLGALMKWLGTLPMWLVPFAIEKAMRLKAGAFRRLKLLVPAVALAVILRGALTIPANYYFALPIWTGLAPAEAMAYLPWWIIFGMNAAQGAIEVVVAWLLVFRFRLDRFSAWR